MEDSKVYYKASGILQPSTPSLLTSSRNYNNNYCLSHFYLFLAVQALLTKDSKICLKASQISPN